MIMLLDNDDDIHVNAHSDSNEKIKYDNYSANNDGDPKNVNNKKEDKPNSYANENDNNNDCDYSGNFDEDENPNDNSDVCDNESDKGEYSNDFCGSSPEKKNSVCENEQIVVRNEEENNKNSYVDSVNEVEDERKLLLVIHLQRVLHHIHTLKFFFFLFFFIISNIRQKKKREKCIKMNVVQVYIYFYNYKIMMLCMRCWRDCVLISLLMIMVNVIMKSIWMLMDYRFKV